ncbi:MAG: D-Ala-D-Ala carboxypeptidase family metallohydrolase [Melioribacteraceae bacterium]|nr:D-Ala-D-Ala carboxypeptidase family metallohydrolase [Melioribacteraceae bacterium]
MTYLSEHFTLEECYASNVALRKGINNKPPQPYIPNIERLCQKVLEPIRNFYNIPFRPNSVYRSAELNREIGGSTESDHVQGNAADIEIPTVSNYDLAIWIKNHLEFNQLILECYTLGNPSSGWVHVSYCNKNKNEVLTFTKGQYIAGLNP